MSLISKMPSMEGDLKNETHQRPGEFTFTWSIHNFSDCMPKGCLSSPKFVVGFLGNTRWYLMLYTTGLGVDAPGFFSCYLNQTLLNWFLKKKTQIV